ncbi:hypothetical protein ACFWWB_35095 [Streptomyces sp. NPDC058690]|uniref:hypothetical protein n=1 Tax=Streptomyces sp. NPDC058690 TaxID=3346600 RepID=UPI00365D5F4A
MCLPDPASPARSRQKALAERGGGELAVLGFRAAELGLPPVWLLDPIELLALRDVVDGDFAVLRVLGGAKVAGDRYSPGGVVDGGRDSLGDVVVASGSLSAGAGGANDSVIEGECAGE